MERLNNVDSDVVVNCVERVPVSVFSLGEVERRGGEGEGSVREKRDERDEIEGDDNETR
jgi:hypothetical protein